MKSHIHFLITFLAFCLLIACRTQRIIRKEDNFKGLVLEGKYNSMPMADRVNTKGVPLSTQLYVYKKTSIQALDSLTGSFCSHIQSEWVTTLKSDAKGQFSAFLPPGIYSVFVQYENAYYIPYFSGSQWTALFEIKENEPTQLEIIVHGNTNFQ